MNWKPLEFFRTTCRSTNHNEGGMASGGYYLALNSSQKTFPALLLSWELHKHLPIFFLISDVFIQNSYCISFTCSFESSTFYLMFLLVLFQSLWNRAGTDWPLEILSRTILHLRLHLCGLKIKHSNLSNVKAAAMLRTPFFCVLLYWTIQLHTAHSSCSTLQCLLQPETGAKDARAHISTHEPNPTRGAFGNNSFSSYTTWFLAFCFLSLVIFRKSSLLQLLLNDKPSVSLMCYRSALFFA